MLSAISKYENISHNVVWTGIIGEGIINYCRRVAFNNI